MVGCFGLVGRGLTLSRLDQADWQDRHRWRYEIYPCVFLVDLHVICLMEEFICTPN